MAGCFRCSVIILVVLLTVQIKGNAFTEHCLALAESGDCEFYRDCVQSRVACDAMTGYPMAFGYKYCNKFGEHLDQFSAQGQSWVTEVRKCLMRALIGSINNPGVTCSQLTKIALDSHMQCYLDSGPGFCEMIREDVSRSALCDVYDTGVSFEKYWKQTWKQVFSSLGRCYSRLWPSMAFAEFVTVQDGLLDEVALCARDKLGSFVLSSGGDRRRRSLASDAEVAEFVEDADCGFWEALENKFPCKATFDWSLASSFLLPICLKFERYASIGQSSATGRWMKQTHQCLMRHLLPVYESTSADCLQIDASIRNNVISCIVDAGFCQLERADEFFLDRGLNAEGFPARTYSEYVTKPLSGKADLVDTDYLYMMRWFKALLGDANVRCYDRNWRTSPDLYEELYSPTYGVPLRFRTEL